MVKKEIRVIGIDDAPFNKFNDSKVLVVGVVMRGGSWVDGILSTKVAVDGDDSTKKIIEMINKCKFKPQLQCIFLDGIAVGGFNVIDVKELSKKTKLPVMVIIRRQPDIENIKNFLLHCGEKGVSAQSRNLYLNAIKFYYRNVVGTNHRLAGRIVYSLEPSNKKGDFFHIC